ncbi:hypothetical protein LJC14_00330 [Treponema sp. OttesenSCG-928-L16]|nr:hypothetical protein [Treponema sp. OttesenSCG-928-L16]
MKKSALFAVMLIMALALGLVFIGCDTGTNGGGGTGDPIDPEILAFLEGTWDYIGQFGDYMEISGNTFTRTGDNGKSTSGTYTIIPADDESGSITFRSNTGSWSSVYSYKVLRDADTKQISLTYKSGAQELNVGNWTKQ